MDKIQIGYGSDQRRNNPKGCYGGRSTGLKVMNGGFNGLPTVSFENISDDKFTAIFGDAYIPKWKRDLLERGESLD